MAIVLIGFGMILLISQFSKLSATEIAVKLWPGILILLGVEILYFAYERKKSSEDIVIKYDMFSMFIVTIILIVNIGIYGLIETGILDYFKLVVNNETIRYERNTEYYMH